MKVTKRQLRRIIKETMDRRPPDYRDLVLLAAQTLADNPEQRKGVHTSYPELDALSDVRYNKPELFDYLEEDIRDELDAMGVTDIDDYRLSQFVDSL